MAIYVVVLTKEDTATFWDDLSREIAGLHKPNSRVYFDYLFRNGLNNRVFSSHTDENSLCSLAIEPVVNDILFDIYVFNRFYNKNIEDGIMLKGMIVRHLMLPGLLNDSKEVIKYLYDTYNDNCYISIMNQYTPLPQVRDIKELNRHITKREYNKVVDYAIDLGVENAFIQEGGADKDSFIPEFNYEGVEKKKKY